MPYVPPKYPGAIPTAEDLPNRADDVDWMYAARYNELKKELRAALIELGTDPAGTFATVKARLDDLLPHFHDRGDVADWNFRYDNPGDQLWHDIDLSGIVPAGAQAVDILMGVRSPVVAYWCALRKKGDVGAFSKHHIIPQVANLWFNVGVTVACDTNRCIQYTFNHPTYPNKLNLAINGWWK